MKYKAGDILENEDSYIREIQGSIGKVYFTTDERGNASLYSEKELDRLGYKKKEREIPPDGTAVKVWQNGMKPEVRISAGKLNSINFLSCYDSGWFEGDVFDWENWELIK